MILGGRVPRAPSLTLPQWERGQNPYPEEASLCKRILSPLSQRGRAREGEISEATLITSARQSGNIISEIA